MPPGIDALVRATLPALIAVLALAGCGGAPVISRPVAARLASEADAVAAGAAEGDWCAARDHARTLQRRLVAAIGAGRIPPRYRKALRARVNELDRELEPRCLPTPAPAPQRPVQQQRTAPPPPQPKGHGRGKEEGHGKGHPHGHGHGHGKGHGD